MKDNGVKKKISCSLCGQVIESRKRPDRYKRAFCSLECRNNFQKNGEMIPCKRCGKNVYRTPSDLKDVKGVFCSHTCSSSFNNNGVRRYGYHKYSSSCEFCQKPKKRSPTRFCSQKCSQEFRYHEFIKQWLAGNISGSSGFGVSHYIRRYLFELREPKCEKCGWSKMHPISGTIPVHIDHINGDWRDNTLKNLRILCPSCHSITPTYGVHNKGKGRRLSGKNG